MVILPGNHDPLIAASAYARGAIAEPVNVHVLGITHDEIVVGEHDRLVMGGAEHVDVGRLGDGAARVSRFGDQRVVVAGQDDDGKRRVVQQPSGPAEQVDRQPVVLEDVADQQHHVDGCLASGLEHNAKPPRPVAAVGARGVAVVDVEVRAVDDRNVIVVAGFVAH